MKYNRPKQASKAIEIPSPATAFFLSVYGTGGDAWRVSRLSTRPSVADLTCSQCPRHRVASAWWSAQHDHLNLGLKEELGGRYGQLLLPALLFDQVKFCPKVGDYLCLLFPRQD